LEKEKDGDDATLREGKMSSSPTAADSVKGDLKTRIKRTRIREEKGTPVASETAADADYRRNGRNELQRRDPDGPIGYRGSTARGASMSGGKRGEVFSPTGAAKTACWVLQGGYEKGAGWVGARDAKAERPLKDPAA